MSRTDDRRERTLPVTGEVGSEGGSYADATMQISTFEGDLGRTAKPRSRKPSNLTRVM
jgi:hypothetical protein